MLINNQILSPDTLPIVPSMVWLGFSFAVFIVSMISVAFIKKFSPPENGQSVVKTVLIFLVDVIKKPFLFFLIGYTLFVTIYGTLVYTPALPANYEKLFFDLAIYVRKITEFLAFFWLVLNVLNKGELGFCAITKDSPVFYCLCSAPV
jgi:hypothetical protein